MYNIISNADIMVNKNVFTCIVEFSFSLLIINKYTVSQHVTVMFTLLAQRWNVLPVTNSIPTRQAVTSVSDSTNR